MSVQQSSEDDFHLLYMRRCLQLAAQGGGYTAPNPMVGAVLVCGNQIIGEGYHQRYGGPHAEPNAIHSVKQKELLRQSTLYVSLEPCSHFGKTPPCANLIVASGIPKVVIGTLDPNPKVAGRGVEILQQAGVEVIVGVLQHECVELNKRFFTYQEKKRPFILLKWAQTKDGFIDKIRTDLSVSPLAISNESTRMLTHKMRAENQAIMVSTNTVLLDNPSLTVRHWTGKSPIRVVIDRQGRIPQDYKVFDRQIPTIVFTALDRESQAHLEFVKIDFNENCLQHILQQLFERNIHSVLVEGGARLLQSFFSAGLWDEANVEIANFMVGDGVSAPQLPSLPVRDVWIDGHRWLLFRNTQ